MQHTLVCVWLLTIGFTFGVVKVVRSLDDVIKNHWCWKDRLSYVEPYRHPGTCCDPAFGVRGDENCWNSTYTYALCCRLRATPYSAKFSNQAGLSNVSNRDRLFGRLFQYLESEWHSKLPGDYVELGVWQGKSAVLVARIMQALKAVRRMWLFDSWEGLPDTTAEDGVHSKSLVGTLKDASPTMVRRRVLSTRHPANMLHIVHGWFHESIPVSVASLAGRWKLSIIRGIPTLRL
eukprot:gnl/TRDRNA2_/TRDRNA2_163004_c0_seq3.p1 gnl/TRDRNA2_/TRDRNA2_163004_c0~~gnl/TRDRNA2_/TRDRNA2_163004_c0_seq3.p1  ORF type:complete len:234 (-),score=7.86 gnl/TRDRNA2_/TRDRNA2_163004_c0_seq3:538-1239(-)